MEYALIATNLFTVAMLYMAGRKVAIMHNTCTVMGRMVRNSVGAGLTEAEVRAKCSVEFDKARNEIKAQYE